MSATTKQRLDNILAEKGLYSSRSRAQAAIMAGDILVNGTKITKPGTRFEKDVDIEIIGKDIGFVSRGGLKLQKAIECFNISFAGKTVLDLGASTGGFVDCALKSGAEKVFAVDVGYGQLAWSLRTSPRVVNIERKNARNLTYEEIGELVDTVTIDVSFISLRLVLPAAQRLLKQDGEIIALIKPQFEAGKEKVGRNGVVRDAGVHTEVINRILSSAEDFNLTVKGITHSPVRGPKGNIEYLAYLDKSGSADKVSINVENVVNTAWQSLDSGA